jgi:hypothetical protein
MIKWSNNLLYGDKDSKSQGIYSSGSFIYYTTNNTVVLALLKVPAHFCIYVPKVFLIFFLLSICAKGPQTIFSS